MASADPIKQASTTAAEVYAQRHAAWSRLHRLYGPGRSYPYAWRLPELARPLGQAPLHQALHALALDLYTLGRFEEARAALPASTLNGACDRLRYRTRLLLEPPETHEPTDNDMPPLEAAYLAYLRNRPQDWPESDPADMDETMRHWHHMLGAWAAACRGMPVPLAQSQRSLDTLRKLHPALGAQAEAIHAETRYCQGPRWAVVWLDHALDQVDLFSQHHLKARLLGLKARALEAAGELGEGSRFRKLARALAERQGARLYLRLFIDEP